MNAQLDEARLGLAALPTHLHGGLLRYIEDGIRPGAFLCSIIDNDLLGAVCHAGEGIGLDDLRRLARFFYNDCPSQCHGSKSKRLDWEGQGGLIGAGREHARE
ncbi:hypothetical protein [Sphingomonas sp. HMP6]|uniref:hypothetical protein n=1 Tax=Sphingomonas sp. HMP6 TaxID=1517551 RepID=UPI0015969A66|nr:hypothetical protein [Sphingomonas sp. HMP6]BCA57705.1 hypothetical protein HMP06_0474 [Sphingomonas sp. HMP6]